MRRPDIHLRMFDIDDNLTHTACGRVSINWTTDPQAVTCPHCIGKMELQPA